MKVIQLAEFDRPHAGSFIPFLLGLMKEAKARGYECEAIFPEAARDAPWLGDFEEIGAVATIAPFGTAADRVKRSRWLMSHLARADEPLILHTHFTTWDVPVVLAMREKEGAVFWHVHSTLSHTPLSRLRIGLKFLLFGRRTQGLLCPAPNIAEDSIRTGAPAELVHFVPSSLDVERFPAMTPDRRSACRAELDLPADATVLLHFGWHWHLKGSDIFLDVAKRLADSGASIVAIDRGGGSEMTEYAAKIGLGDRFRLIPPVPDIQTLHGAADIVVSSSRDEGMAYAVIESLISGTPVVATRIPGHEFIGEHVKAMKMTSQEVGDIAAGIEEVLAWGPEEAQANREQTRAWVIENLSVGAIAKDVVDMYEAAV